VSTSKRKHDGEDKESSRRSRSNSHSSKLRQQCEEGRSLHGGTSLYETDNSKYSNRIFGCLAISPAGRALSTFRSGKGLITALRDAITGHRSLYTAGNILHRDISYNNIIITDLDSAYGFTGMLIDLDLGKIVGSRRSGARHQTGTVGFMAIQVLQKVAHTYRHDLESFFYVLLWICARRSWEVEYHCEKSQRIKHSRLGTWYTGRFDQIAEAKRGYMHVDGIEDILREFPKSLDCVKPLCRHLRSILFPLRPTGELDMRTHTPVDAFYSSIIKAFDDAITTLA
jgi:serine/threonine protein kinase